MLAGIEIKTDNQVHFHSILPFLENFRSLKNFHNQNCIIKTQICINEEHRIEIAQYDGNFCFYTFVTKFMGSSDNVRFQFF